SSVRASKSPPFARREQKRSREVHCTCGASLQVAAPAGRGVIVRGGGRMEPSVEARTREIGAELLGRIEEHHPGAAERLQDWLLTDALQDAAFRERMLRFVDVFAAVEASGDAEELHRLLGEYFAGDFPGIPRSLRWMLRLGRDQKVPST